MNTRERIAVIVPALDEAETIAEVIRRVPYGPHAVTVVDNGSTDATAQRAYEAGARVIRVTRPGYGRACLAGIDANPDAEVFVFLDADLSETPEDMPVLVNPILRGEADFVLGARGGRGRPWHARLGTSVCVSAINRLWGTRYRDLGPFRAIRAASLRALDMQDQTWGWTIEMQVKASECDLRWLEIPVASGPRVSGRSKISGSLVGTVRAGGRMLETIARLRLSVRDRAAVAAMKPHTR
jgi:glycosyltransferase involved in cell wall biosynthesis